MGTRLLHFVRGILLVAMLTVGVPGCITMPDGTSTPDYTMIEFGAVAAFTVIINETKVSDAKVLQAYDGLSNVEKSLRAMVESGEPLDLAIVDHMLANAVPLEYKALASLGSRLIRERAALYLGEKVPDVDLGEYEVVGKITLAVVQGATAAIEPRAAQIRK